MPIRHVKQLFSLTHQHTNVFPIQKGIFPPFICLSKKGSTLLQYKSPKAFEDLVNWKRLHLAHFVLNLLYSSESDKSLLWAYFFHFKVVQIFEQTTLISHLYLLPEDWTIDFLTYMKLDTLFKILLLKLGFIYYYF